MYALKYWPGFCHILLSWLDVQQRLQQNFQKLDVVSALGLPWGAQALSSVVLLLIQGLVGHRSTIISLRVIPLSAAAHGLLFHKHVDFYFHLRHF